MLNIAVVEDQQFIAHTIAQIIEQSQDDFHVCGIFPNGKACLEDLEHCAPDLILTDIRMPVMDGLQLAQEVFDHYPYIKIILLTGYEDFSYAKQAIRLGITDYLLKPTDPEELLTTIRKADTQIFEEQHIRTTLDEYYGLIENLPTLKQQALLSVLYRSSSLSNTDFHKLQMQPFLQELVFVAVEIPAAPNCSVTTADIDLMLYGYCNILSELLEPYPQREVFICSPKIFLFLPLSGSNSTRQQAVESIQSAVRTAVQYLHYEMNIVSIQSVSNVFEIQICGEAPLPDIVRENSQDNGKPLSAKDSLAAAISYIQKNYAQGLSLQDVADHIFLSYNYLSRVFSQQMGLSFSTYLTKVRIEKACELLENPRLRVSQIAESVGYSNYRYFAQVFKKLTDCTPGDYRKLHCSDYYTAEPGWVKQ